MSFTKEFLSKKEYLNRDMTIGRPIKISQLLLYKYNKLRVTPYTRGDADVFRSGDRYINTQTHFGAVVHPHTSLVRFLDIQSNTHFVHRSVFALI